MADLSSPGTRIAIGCGSIVFTALSLTVILLFSGNDAKVSTKVSVLGFLEQDRLSTLLSRCKPPTMDTSSEYEVPRPIMVTRVLTWSDQSVRAFYVPTGRLGDEPPYADWQLFAWSDPGRKIRLTPAEAADKLKDICKPPAQ